MLERVIPIMTAEVVVDIGPNLRATFVYLLIGVFGGSNLIQGKQLAKKVDSIAGKLP